MRFFRNQDKEVIELRRELAKHIKDMENEEMDTLTFGATYNILLLIYKKVLTKSVAGISEEKLLKYQYRTSDAIASLRV